MRIISLFSGIGAFEEALHNIGVEMEIVNYCEFNKYASRAYSLIHNVPESKNLGDIKNVNENGLPKDIDLITYGFPCQDISGIGKQKGLINLDGTKTRSGLVFDAFRIINSVKPKYAIMENVKNLIGKKFKDDFDKLLNILDEMGYNNYYKVLNAKDYTIPQNRERVFVVSIRKDIDKGFEFPRPQKLETMVQDLLCDRSDERIYVKQHLYGAKFDLYGKLKNTSWERRRNSMFLNKSVAYTLTTKNPMSERAFHGRMYTNDLIGTDIIVTEDMRKDIANNKYTFMVYSPREYFRLMGFSDNSFDKIKNEFSNTQLYKMVGNSIVVNVLEEIFKKLLKLS